MERASSNNKVYVIRLNITQRFNCCILLSLTGCFAQVGFIGWQLVTPVMPNQTVVLFCVGFYQLTKDWLGPKQLFGYKYSFFFSSSKCEINQNKIFIHFPIHLYTYQGIKTGCEVNSNNKLIICLKVLIDSCATIWFLLLLSTVNKLNEL